MKLTRGAMRAKVVEETVAGDDMVMIRGCKNNRAVTVLLRGANDYMLDEMDRSLHDALSIVKRVLESGKVVAGACVASALACAAVLLPLLSMSWSDCVEGLDPRTYTL